MGNSASCDIYLVRTFSSSSSVMAIILPANCKTVSRKSGEEPAWFAAATARALAQFTNDIQTVIAREFATIKQDIETIKQDIETIKQDIETIKQNTNDIPAIKADIRELKQHSAIVGVLFLDDLLG
ncbi:hypothetical protein B0H34DRAFT_393505 [Crassisporium funariophilum]|nr:hypothetical protein B0H34DRAFT_393505 [Crassisporium funariophilum]